MKLRVVAVRLCVYQYRGMYGEWTMRLLTQEDAATAVDKTEIKRSWAVTGLLSNGIKLEYNGGRLSCQRRLWHPLCRGHHVRALWLWGFDLCLFCGSEIRAYRRVCALLGEAGPMSGSG